MNGTGLVKRAEASEDNSFVVSKTALCRALVAALGSKTFSSSLIFPINSSGLKVIEDVAITSLYQ